jgi:signal transduction histidine kinase
MGFATSEIVIDFLDGLSDAKDTKDLITKTIELLPRFFGPFTVAALLISDREVYNWRILPIENPRRPSWGGVTCNDLIPDADVNYLAEISGKDATVCLGATPKLTERFVHQDKPFFLASRDEPAIWDLGVLCGANIELAFASGWNRRSGGKAWMVLGYEEIQPDPYDLLEDFNIAVKVFSKMLAYPSLLQFIARREAVTHSLRRNIVHDLKTPMTVIKGAAESINYSIDVMEKEDIAEMLAMIIEQSDRMLDDLADILNPLETWTPTFVEFDVASMVQRAAIDERYTKRSQGKEIIVEGTDGPTTMDGDLRKLKRMIENLLSNAVKYSPGEGKKVWMRLDVDEEWVRISFRDQGIGMNEQQLAKVMSETGRVVDRTVGIEGSGYGLDSCRAIAAAHGGQITAESEVGIGSTFTVTMPRRQVSPFN